MPRATDALTCVKPDSSSLPNFLNAMTSSSKAATDLSPGSPYCWSSRVLRVVLSMTKSVRRTAESRGRKSAQITSLLQMGGATTQWVHAPGMINYSTNARQCAEGILGQPLWGVTIHRFDSPSEVPSEGTVWLLTRHGVAQVHGEDADFWVVFYLSKTI